MLALVRNELKIDSQKATIYYSPDLGHCSVQKLKARFSTDVEMKDAVKPF